MSPLGNSDSCSSTYKKNSSPKDDNNYKSYNNVPSSSTSTNAMHDHLNGNYNDHSENPNGSNDDTDHNHQDMRNVPDIKDSNFFLDDEWIHLIPDSEILKQQSNFLKKDTIWTENDNVQVSLLKILHEIKAPLYMFDKIMNWAADANTSSYRFSSVFLIIEKTYDMNNTWVLKSTQSILLRVTYHHSSF